MFVAMPTAMPLEPLTSSCGKRPGSTIGSAPWLSKLGTKSDGLFIDVGQHLERGARQTRFGIPIGGRRIGIDRTEVAVTVDSG